ncbi:MAG TPA: hypothetical protein ENI85_18365, partial [Deltaproteobacteria bacterium]|nr:hypothetical protein [Deltaproteobacteria bacterium]
MYDAREEPNEFVGEDLAEARAKAAKFFGTDESELKIVVPKEGEIYGLGGRTVIVAVPKGISVRRGGSGGGHGRRDEGRRESREGKRDSRGDFGRGTRGGRNDRGARNENRGGRGARGRSSSDRGGAREDRPDSPRETITREPRKAVHDSKGKAVGTLGPVGEFLLGAIELMKLGSFEISEASEGDYLIFQVRGPAADALQAGDGRATDALQLIANQVSMRQSEDSPRVVVDVEGGGEEREETLTRLAERAAKRARDTGRSIALDPMNSRDRRSIHVTLRDEEGVAT